MGDLGRILHTQDGFQTRELQRSAHDKPQFDVFISPDGRYGWIGTSPNAGHLLRTTDGGGTSRPTFSYSINTSYFNPLHPTSRGMSSGLPLYTSAKSRRGTHGK